MAGNMETVLDVLTADDLRYLEVAKKCFAITTILLLIVLIITVNTEYFNSFLMFLPGCLLIAGGLDVIIKYKGGEKQWLRKRNSSGRNAVAINTSRYRKTS